MSLQSTVGVARPGTRSLRATIPEGIVAFLELSEGEQLDWRMEIDNNTRERFVVVRKAKPIDDKTMKIASKHARNRRR
jgi:hypothetical protein